jgi:hypothetical protein
MDPRDKPEDDGLVLNVWLYQNRTHPTCLPGYVTATSGFGSGTSLTWRESASSPRGTGPP